MDKWIKRHKIFIITIFIAIIIAIAGIVVGQHILGSRREVSKGLRENTVKLTKMNLINSISTTGTLESVKTKTVKANISNVVIKKVNVKEGDEVKKGQKLVTFDEEDLRTSLSEAKESLQDTEAQINEQLASANRKLEEAQENYTSKKKKYAASEKSAKAEYEAAKKAVASAKNSNEKERKEKAEEALKQAKKAYEQAKSERETGNRQNKSNLQSAKEQLVSTKSSNRRSLREAKRKVTQAQEALDDCSVTAPMSGTVVAVNVEAGDKYQGADLLQISDCNNLQVSATVDEYDVSQVEKGQKVIILTNATGEEELEGEITYVAQTVGSSRNNTGSGDSGTMGASSSSSGSSGSSYEVRIQMKSSHEKLRIGMTAKCSIVLKEVEDVFAVPYDALHKNKSGDTVLYVTDGRGTRSEIVVSKGMESDYYVEVSGEGLSENLQVIIPTDVSGMSEDASSRKDNLDDLMHGGMPNGGPSNGGMPNGGPPM